MNDIDFEQWLAHPFTAALMASAKRKAEQCREQWLTLSWAARGAVPTTLDTNQLAYLRGKADIFESLSKIKLKDLQHEQTSVGVKETC